MTREIALLQPFIKDKWYLRHYLIRADNIEKIDHATLIRSFDRIIENFEEVHKLKSIDYFNIGFIISHYGKRGICISIWHWGNWKFTCEMFVINWYCYGRDISKIKFLSINEPRLCVHEVPIITQEMKLFYEISSSESCERLAKFMAFTPIL